MMARKTAGAIGALVLMSIPALAAAAPDAIPKLFHGMWAAGTCAEPKYYFNIDGSGIQGYESDKRTPIGNWDVRKAEQREVTLIIDAPETNTGKSFHFEIAALTTRNLRIKVTGGGKTETTDFENCSPDTQ